MLDRGSTPVGDAYNFKHALIQDAAYQSLLLKTRQQYHGRIANALEAHFPQVLTSQPELLAHHYAAADLYEDAMEYWQRAGADAHSRRANREATRCFEQALVMLPRLPETKANLEKAVDIRLDLRQPLLALGELDRIVSLFPEAERIAKSLGDRQRLARATANPVSTK